LSRIFTLNEFYAVKNSLFCQILFKVMISKKRKISITLTNVVLVKCDQYDCENIFRNSVFSSSYLRSFLYMYLCNTLWFWRKIIG